MSPISSSSTLLLRMGPAVACSVRKCDPAWHHLYACYFANTFKFLRHAFTPAAKMLLLSSKYWRVSSRVLY